MAIGVLLVSIFVGIVSSMLGLGGGFLMVPILSIVLLFPIKNAIGTSMVSVMIMGLSATIAYYRKGLIDLRVCMPLTLGAVVGAQLGATLTGILSGVLLTRIFGLFLVAISVLMIRSSRSKSSASDESSGELHLDNPLRVPLFLALGVVVGIYSGLLGVGGGTITVPALSLMGVGMHMAVASSLFVVFFSGISGSITHYALGHVEVMTAIAASIGIFTGAQMGSRISVGIPAARLKLIFGVAVILIGVRMLLF